MPQFNVILHQEVLEIQTCAQCHIVFAMPDHMITRARKTGSSFYCPNGHRLHFGDSELDRVKKQLALEETRRAQAEAAATSERNRANANRLRAEAAERSVSATRGVVTRMKNRVQNGVCPCCNRHFANLEKHMKGQHPDWKDSNDK